MSAQLSTVAKQDNPKYFVLEVNFLLERYHGKEWPPSPRRLFLAFVAALYQSSSQRICLSDGEEALRFFETQPPPNIHATGQRGCEYKLSVPNNDADKVSEAYARGKTPVNQDKLVTLKPMRPYITDTIQYIWQIDHNEDGSKNIETLCKIANEIPVLGFGIDVVTVHGKVTEHMPNSIGNEDCYVPDENIKGGIRINVPLPGLLDDAKRHHEEFLRSVTKKSFIQPKPITHQHSQKYRKYDPATEIISHKITNIQNRNHVVPNYMVCELIEKINELKQVPDEDKDHVKTIIMPSIGSRHSDSQVRRVGFLVHPNTQTKTKQMLSQGLNSQIIEISSQKYQLELLSGHKDNVHKAYESKSRLWCSVTPLDLSLEKNMTRQDVIKSILHALREEGIDNTVTFVDFRREPYWSSLSKIPNNSTQIYAEIEFASHIRGAFVIGGKQNMSHGLFAPKKLPNVAYYAVLGNRPPVEKTIMVADLMRRSIMSRIKSMMGEKSIPSYISGHDVFGNSLRDNHEQAFWLPVDSDHDGLIDNIVIFVRNGVGRSIQSMFYTVTRMQNDQGLKLDVSFKGFHSGVQLSNKFDMFKKSTKWRAVTPYFMPWHIKKNLGRDEQVRKEWEKRKHHSKISKIRDHKIQVMDRQIPITKFQSMRNGKKPINSTGEAITISFNEPVNGPVVLGGFSHFGMGMFTPC